jgi:hypothetical protein
MCCEFVGKCHQSIMQIHHLLILEDGLTCKPNNIYTGPHKILSVSWIEVQEI